jgi:signal peptidase I
MSWSEKFSVGDWPATVQSVAGTVVIAVFVVTFLVQAFTIPSESMEKTLLIGDYLLVDKFCYGGSTGWNRLLPYRNVRRGDIVVFDNTKNTTQDIL